MPKELKNKREDKKKATLTPKEKKAAKRAKQESTLVKSASADWGCTAKAVHERRAHAVPEKHPLCIGSVRDGALHEETSWYGPSSSGRRPCTVGNSRLLDRLRVIVG